MKLALTLLTTAGLTIATVSHAAVLVDYEFGGGSVTATSSDSNLSASDFSDVYSGEAGGSTSGNYFFRATDGNHTFEIPASHSAALADPAYLTFNITPDVGYQADLTSLTFDWGGQKSSSGANDWTLHFGVYTSVDGFASTADAVDTGSYAISGTSTSFDGQTITFSGAKFDGLTGQTDFRIYFWADPYPTAGSNANSNLGRIDNVTLNGTVTVIPEPSAAMLLISALGLVVLFRRRRA